MSRLAVGFAILVVAPACAKAPPAPARRYGDAMSEVGTRFERTGRAVVAGRWELADYDLGELAEVFVEDLPRAPKPEDVPVDPAPIAAAFASKVLPSLQAAVKAHDRAAFDHAFAAAAAACNACHQAAAKPFIEVPSTPGAAVPDLTPPPAP